MSQTPGGAAGEIPRELKLDLPAVHAGARLARHLLRPFARSNGITGRDLDGLLLVAEELLTNAVDHGGGKSAFSESDLVEPVRMSMRLLISKGTWEMSVSDQGGGDPATIQRFLDPNELPDLEDERGRGFFLLNSMVEQLTVKKSEDGKGIVVIALSHYGARS